MTNHSELLIGLSVDELEALADGVLAPSAQARLDELLAQKSEGQLPAKELVELDHLLQKSDYLTTL